MHHRKLNKEMGSVPRTLKAEVTNSFLMNDKPNACDSCACCHQPSSSKCNLADAWKLQLMKTSLDLFFIAAQSGSVVTTDKSPYTMHICRDIR